MVRKHRAPKGALRPFPPAPSSVQHDARKHRAPNGALRQKVPDVFDTVICVSESTECHKVHKDRANGRSYESTCSLVRKHRAPKGVLRLGQCRVGSLLFVLCQKAPSAKRCIKTQGEEEFLVLDVAGQKAPSAKRRIKTGSTSLPRPTRCLRSESTERQKVH